jgi:hypothetical protein
MGAVCGVVAVDAVIPVAQLSVFVLIEPLDIRSDTPD